MQWWGEPVSLPARISVVVTTYNNPQFLEMVLRSLAGQRRSGGCPAYEVVVADDGSGPETAGMLDRLRPQLDYELLHAWQPDDGFRVAAARNNALAIATGDYVVFVDGDCLVPAGFVATHARLAEAGCFVAGARSFIKQRQTRRMLAEPERWARLDRFAWFFRALAGNANRPFQLLALPGNGLRHRHPDQWQGVQTCNLGVWRADIDQVDGYDMSYVGHGLEDSDFALRLLRAGIRRKSGRFASIVLHLWHPRPGGTASPNCGLFESLLNSSRYLPVSGLSDLRKADAA